MRPRKRDSLNSRFHPKAYLGLDDGRATEEATEPSHEPVFPQRELAEKLHFYEQLLETRMSIAKSFYEPRVSRAQQASSHHGSEAPSAGRKSLVSHRTNNILECRANKKLLDILRGPNRLQAFQGKRKPRQDSKLTSFVSGIPHLATEDKSTSRFEPGMGNSYVLSNIDARHFPGFNNGSQIDGGEADSSAANKRRGAVPPRSPNLKSHRDDKDQLLYGHTPDFSSPVQRAHHAGSSNQLPGAGQGDESFYTYTTETRAPFDYEEAMKQRREIREQLRTHYYAQIAFVIQSKVEFHDAFKLILTRIYESIKQPKTLANNLVENWYKSEEEQRVIPQPHFCMAFAEIIAHIAYLRTIPAPVFNSQINLLFMDLKINLKENHFTEIPHKSIHPIKVLADCLDFQSILTCLKALLFDKTLIVFSIETSLLFNVIEGLKQLMFPFTFDCQQFLPANNVYRNADNQSLKDLFDELQGLQPVIFALETRKNMETHENGVTRVIEIDDYINWPDSVLLDIDASYVLQSNDIEQELPKFPKEIEVLKSLNRIRNRNLDNYDKIYPSNKISMYYDEDNFNVESIRAIFFTMLTPFLTSAYLAIDLTKRDPRNVTEFFSAEMYFDCIRDEYSDHDMAESAKLDRAIQFAQALVQTRSFSHFMDGYIHDEIMNFDLTNSILCHRGSLTRRYKSPAVTLKPYKDQIKTRVATLSQAEVESLKQRLLEVRDKQHSKFADQQVSFYYRLPSLKQRMMLF